MTSTKSAKKPTEEPGPLARTIREIERGPLCPKCGLSTRRGGHECKR